LNTPVVQRYVTSVVEKKLSALLNTKVKISAVDIDWLNRFIFRDVCIEDKNGSTILEASNITAGFKLRSLLDDKWVMTTVRLFGVSCNIRKETPQSPANIQFIIDALSSGREKQDGSIRLCINSILIQRGRIVYDVMNQRHTPDKFNPHHLYINNISAKIALNHISADSINLRLNKMSMDERSGLEIEKLSMQLLGNRQSMNITDLTASLPYSAITVPEARMQFFESDSNPQILLTLAKSKISPRDLSAFAPVMKDFPDAVELSTNISGFLNDLSLDKLLLKYGDKLTFDGNLNIKVNPDKQPFLQGKVKQLYITTEGLNKISNHLSNKQIRIPEPVMNIREMRFAGELSGFADNLAVNGTLTSPAGLIQMDLRTGQRPDTLFFAAGNLSSSDIQLGSIFREGSQFGKASFSAALNLAQPKNRKLTGTVNARINQLEYRNYSYENIDLSGSLFDSKYEGTLSISDPNGNLNLKGSFTDNTGKPVFNITASVSDLHPDKLHLSDKYPDSELSCRLNAEFAGNTPDDFDGFINISDFAFSTENDLFKLDRFRIESASGEKALRISSDLINGELKGKYSFYTLLPDLFATTGNYLPALINTIHKDNPDISDNNNFTFLLNTGSTESFSRTFNLPAAILGNSYIKGSFNSIDRQLAAEVLIPRFDAGGSAFENGSLRIYTTKDMIDLQINFAQISRNNTHNYFTLNSQASGNKITSRLYWNNDKDEIFESEILAAALFAEDSISGGAKKLRTEITLDSSQMVIKDRLWTIEPASVTLIDGCAMINNFFITDNSQSLRVSGAVSDNPQDALNMELKDIELGYIFNTLNIPVLQFGGMATGSVQARDLHDNMIIEGRLEIRDFSFNNAVQGKLNISSEWDNARKGILLLGTIYKDENTWTDVNGYIIPAGTNQGLSIFFDANELNMAFAQKYMAAFSDSVSGLGYGGVHLFGSFSDIFITGRPFIKNGNIKINVLNTTYSFSDTIRLDSFAITTNNTAIYDKSGNAGYLDLDFRHKNFRNLEYDLDIRTERVLVYDIPETVNPKIYGQVYASGTADISGTEKEILVEGNIKSESGTYAGFNFLDNSMVEDYDFISFKNPAKDTVRTSEPEPAATVNAPSGMDYQLNFTLNITPEATFELAIDPVEGDKIRGSGSGSLQAGYGSQNSLQIFGNYLITDGIYNFSLQQLIRKRFNIRDGSAVTFSGDPMDANLDINAIYSLQADIQDLDATLIEETVNTNIAVNCVLSIDGKLKNPSITFDIELPNSNSELEKQVKSFIDTEDMLTRQIIYLMALNKFYTPEYSRNDYRTSEFTAVASSALSAQLSNILSSFTDKVQIGTNIRSRQDGIKDTEVEMLLSSRLLNNRLLFNGNFGYKDNYIQSNAFIGEFDLEYKLSRSGEISLRAYNHANDLYRYNSKSLTRQGVGISFSKDFSSLTNLLRRRKKEEETQ